MSDIVTPENLADGASVYGVAADGRGTVSFTESGEGEITGDYTGFVKRVLPNGKIKTVGDTGTFEETYNPDQINTYGFLDLDPECAAQMDAVIPGSGASYPGAVDSNSYSVAIVGGSRIVADAAGNDIVRVSPKGTVSSGGRSAPDPGHDHKGGGGRSRSALRCRPSAVHRRRGGELRTGPDRRGTRT